ncbi:PEP-CTERM sorting domain-containing protein [Alkalinema pantanalense CENA528]
MFPGPDYKVVAAKVPEPTVLLGLAMAGGSLPLLRRRKLA